MYIEDKSLICFFLRTVITDPKNRISLLDSDSVTLTDDTIVSVTSTSNISHISNLELDSVPLTAFVDYVYDIKNRKIVFFESKTGDLTYDIYGGSNWIFDDTPRKEDLSKDSFPRISIIYVSRTNNILGNFDAKEEINNRIQVDVWSKKDQVFTVNIGDYSSNLGEDKLVMYLASECSNKLKENAWDLTYYYFKDFIPITKPTNQTYNSNYELYNSKFEFFIKTIK